MLDEEYDAETEDIQREEFTLDEYKLKLEALKSNIESSFYSNYNNIKLLKDNLDTAERQLALAKVQNEKDHLQYDLGQMSKRILATKDAEYLQKQLSFKQQQYEFSIAVATYEMVANGYQVK